MRPDAQSQAWARRGAEVLLPTYNRYPVALVRGEGARVWDADDREYVDFCAGLAVCTLGHGHAGLARAVGDQAARLIHTSNLYHIPAQIELAERLTAWTAMDRFFFCNSGTEANEALIKFARRWGGPQGRWRLVVTTNGFHGRTLGALSATAQPGLQQGFGPLLDGFDAVPFGDAAAAAAAIGPETAAVLVEPVQAEGGANFAPDGYFAALRRACDDAGVLLLVDEVQLGIGRAGAPLMSPDLGAVPDAVSLAKGLGGGVPIGAIGVLGKHADVLGPRSHGSTFGGNPLSCAAAGAVLDVIAADGFLDTVRAKGERVLTELRGWPELQDASVRGRGLFVAFQVADTGAFVPAALAAGVLVAPAKGNAVRLLPPLTIDDAELDEGLTRLRSVVAQHEGPVPA